jgi:threonylcarbamoyladenosine tRNA methylthiotransferase MtaB
MLEVVPMHVRRERNEILQRLSENKRRNFYREHLGQSREVLLEPSKREGFLQGFTDNYIKVMMPEKGHKVNTLALMTLGDYHAESNTMHGADKGQLRTTVPTPA